MTASIRLLLFALLSVTASLGIAQTDEVSVRLDQVATAYHRHRHFIGSVLVAQRGRILLDKGYGEANLEWDIANTPDTKFRLGSITKQFTATAVLQLAEQGKLSTDDLACKYFDGCPEAWRRSRFINC